MTTVFRVPQARCKAGLARADITPPMGIYHRMWGAALHDRATGIHRPLTATALFLENLGLVLALDHCILDPATFERIRAACSGAGPVQVCLTHTHGSGWLSPSRKDLPGGELIEPYLDTLVATCGRVAEEAQAKAEPATLIFGTGRCNLAAHRDFLDTERKQFVCGFNPEGPADDTLLAVKVAADGGRTLGTVVNYACHPTTLAWENTLISPDYLGAMREVVEHQTGGPCLFLQGASGDLGPREGFVGDAAVADKNGRQLGYAVLSLLESLPPAGTEYVYDGPVVSGATLGTWRHVPREVASRGYRTCCEVELPYRHDLPKLEATQAELARWQELEAAGRAEGNEPKVRDCRAQSERMTRQIARLESLPAGPAYPYRYRMLALGPSVWLFCPGELYQAFQTALRSRFPERVLLVATVAGDWQPGYIPAAEAYGQGIYQETISPLAPGSLERLIDAVRREVERAIASGQLGT